MHVPSGLWVYGMYQNEDNHGTQWKSFNFNTVNGFVDSSMPTTAMSGS